MRRSAKLVCASIPFLYQYKREYKVAQRPEASLRSNSYSVAKT